MAKTLIQEDLKNVSGGSDVYEESPWKDVKASSASGYLSLRSFPCENASNIIARIPDGVVFRVNSNEWSGSFVRASFHNLSGWVHEDFIVWI